MNASAATMIAPTRSRVWMSFALAAMLIASLFSTAVGIQTASAQESQAGLASATPADTVLYMSVNLDQSTDQWGLTYSLLERAGISELVQNQTGASTEQLGDVAESQGVSGAGALVFTDADSLVSYSSSDFSGAMDTTMSMDGDDISEEVPEGFAFIVQPDDPDALATQFVTMAEDEATAAGATVETVDYSGVTITYWESTDPATSGTATAVVDGTVVLATRTTDVEPIIDAAQGNVDNLADSEGFADVTGRLQADTLMLGYMNLDVMVTAFQNDPSFTETAGDLASVEDLEAAKGHVGWAVYASDAGFHFDSVVIPNDPSTIPATDGFTPGMASKVPADVMIFSGANDFYGTGITEVLGELFQTAMSEPNDMGTAPAATPTMDETWAMFEEQLGFNPDADLLAKLDGEYAILLGVHDLESGMPSPEFLFVSETSDAATLQETTATISNMVEMMNEGEYTVSSRSVDGGELTVITLDAENTSGIPVVIEFGVVNDEMLIGVNDAVDHYLDPASEKLADDANFQNTMSLLPSENVVNQSYVNIEGQVMPLLDWFSTMLMGSMSTLDNHEDCGTYATQQEAQDAYDADPGEMWLLDMDYDGQACEDFFGESMPSASPASITSGINIPSAGSVTTVDGDAIFTSSILVIGD